MEIVAFEAQSTQNLQARHTSKSTQIAIHQCLMTHAGLRNRTLVMHANPQPIPQSAILPFELGEWDDGNRGDLREILFVGGQ